MMTRFISPGSPVIGFGPARRIGRDRGLLGRGSPRPQRAQLLRGGVPLLLGALRPRDRLRSRILHGRQPFGRGLLRLPQRLRRVGAQPRMVVGVLLAQRHRLPALALDLLPRLAQLVTDFAQPRPGSLGRLLRTCCPLHRCIAFLSVLCTLTLRLFPRRTHILGGALFAALRLGLGVLYLLGRFAAGCGDRDLCLITRSVDILHSTVTHRLRFGQRGVTFLPRRFRVPSGILGGRFGGITRLFSRTAPLLGFGQRLLRLGHAMRGIGVRCLHLGFRGAGIGDGAEFIDGTAQRPGKLIGQRAELAEQIVGAKPSRRHRCRRDGRRRLRLLFGERPLAFLPCSPAGVVGKIAVLGRTPRSAAALHRTRAAGKPARTLPRIRGVSMFRHAGNRSNPVCPHWNSVRPGGRGRDEVSGVAGQ